MTSSIPLSIALEDYLKIIYKLQEPISSKGDKKGVSTSDIATRLSVSKASVSNMIKKLSDKGYIDYAPYYGVTLTESGQQIALGMIRKHRILEQFLVERLGYGWDEVDAEAEVLEHAISDKLANKMWHDLGCPTHDPHGSPIPSETGEIAPSNWPCMAQCEQGERLTIERIQNRTPDELRYLTSIGLVRGTTATIQAIAPFNGPVTICIDGSVCAIDFKIAQSIFVSDNLSTISLQV